MLESAYQQCMVCELPELGLSVKEQIQVPIIYKEIEIEYAYKLDLLVNGGLIIELKTVESIMPVHEAQILTYLRFMGICRGLIINFRNTL